MLTQSQGHLDASACHIYTPGAEPPPALTVPGSAHRLWLGASLNSTDQSQCQPLDSFLDPDGLSPPVPTPS